MSALKAERPVTYEEAVTKHFLAQYVRAREGWLPPAAEANFRQVSIMSTPAEQQRWADAFRPANPQSPQVVYGSAARRRSPSAPSASSATGVANVRFRRTVRLGQQVTESDWIATVAFTYTKAPMSEGRPPAQSRSASRSPATAPTRRWCDEPLRRRRAGGSCPRGRPSAQALDAPGPDRPTRGSRSSTTTHGRWSRSRGVFRTATQILLGEDETILHVARRGHHRLGRRRREEHPLRQAQGGARPDQSDRHHPAGPAGGTPLHLRAVDRAAAPSARSTADTVFGLRFRYPADEKRARERGAVGGGRRPRARGCWS